MTTPQPPAAPAFELSFKPIAIHTADGPALTAAAPDTVRDAWVGRDGGERRSGRLPYPLTPGRWKVARASDLAPDLFPDAVYESGDRVLVTGASLWQLFDLGGHSLATGRIGGGGATLDPSRRCFYAADPTGPLKAWKLADGAPAYAIEPFFGAEFERVHVARHGDAITIASVERPTDPHSPRRPDLTALEVQRVPESPAVTPLGFLERTDRTGKLMLSSTDVAIAGSAAGLVIASHDTIYLAGPDLQVGAALRGEFESLALSLDESDRLYLLARRAGHTSVACIERDGRRRFDCEVAEIAAADARPAAVGLDHRVWVRAGNRVTVISPDGRVLATAVETAPVAGLTLTADGWALVTEGASIVALRPVEKPGVPPSFERHLLFTSPDGALVTPAILVSSGQLLVGSAKRVLRLEASLE